jgi:prepilin-type N-terminal cleavage/methylation domain-containing protein/prepilin-type processing-associated H-X9-DG protein
MTLLLMRLRSSAVLRSRHHETSAVRDGFTLIELLVVIAILAVVASILMPTLSRGKEKAQSVACLSNLKQLQTCWHMYTVDFQDFLPPNNSVVAASSGASVAAGASWCAGSPRYDTTTTNIENGVLFPYSRSVAIYHCPSDDSTVENSAGAKLPLLRNRSYNMSQSVNGFPDYDLVMRDYIPAFRKLGRIANPNAAECLVFIDEHADTMYDALFGMPTDHYDGSQTWWDLPGNRHGQAANLTFADGHVEHWRWRVPKVFRSWIQPVTPEELPDWRRLKNSMKQQMQ